MFLHGKAIITAINVVWNNSTAYDVDTIAYYVTDGVVYKCIIPITGSPPYPAPPSDTVHWEATAIIPVRTSTVGGVTINNCQPNGAPRNSFGAFRLEGVTQISIVGCPCFPGSNAPGTGMTFTSFVVSDGGQTPLSADPITGGVLGYTQDITITGGQATVQASSALYYGATIYAFQFDGIGVRNVSCINVGVDVTTPNANLVTLTDSGTGMAEYSNGITIMYGNNAGRVNIQDATGNHSL